MNGLTVSVTDASHHAGMRAECHQRVPQLVLQSVHDGQDDDQRGNPHAHPEKGRPGYEGHEELIGPRPYIAQAHKQRQGVKHRRDLTTLAAWLMTRVTVSMHCEGRPLLQIEAGAIFR